MKKILFALICAVSLFAVSCSKDSGFELKRGTNISHWLSQCGFFNEERATKYFTEADIKNMHDLGFDHLRIPIDEMVMWDRDGNQVEAAWRLLHNAVDWCMKYNMRSIIDLHVLRSHSFIDVAGRNTLFSSEEEQDKLIGLWYQISDSFKDVPVEWLAYEFLNEPIAPEHSQWNALVAKVHKALREREPKRVLVIGSNNQQSYDTVKYLEVPENDPNIILSFHFYHPMMVTHYQAMWCDMRVCKGPVHYPGKLITDEEFAELSDRDKEILKEFNEEWNRDRLYNMMKDAIDTAKRLKLQLFCGEWGVYDHCPAEAKYAWYKDMISIFDEFGIAWTNWDYKDSFGFWKPDGSGFSDKEMLDALMSGKALGE